MRNLHFYLALLISFRACLSSPRPVASPLLSSPLLSSPLLSQRLVSQGSEGESYIILNGIFTLSFSVLRE